MTAGIWNTIMDQGSTWLLQVVYQDPNGDPIDLTGFSGEMQLRSQAQDAQPALTLSTANGDITIDGPNGVINVAATSAQTEAVDEGPYYYDLEVRDIASDEVSRIIQGQIVVSAEVTR